MSIFESQLSTPITLTALEFDVLWEHLGYERMPLVLNVPSPGKTYTERAHIVGKAWNSLAAKGLTAGPTTPSRRLVDLLSVLDRPEREVDARLSLDSPVRALAAAKGRNGVMASRINDEIRLTAANPDQLPSEVLSLLSQRQTGHGRSVNIPSAELDAAAKKARTPTEFADELIKRRINSADAHALVGMVNDVTHTGQFGAAARDRTGQRQRAGYVVGFFDNPTGRYLQLRRAQGTGPEWSTIAPADHQLLMRHVTSMLDEIIS